MKQFISVEDILNFAIQLEKDTIDFYKDLTKNAVTPDMKQVFEQFAREEMVHKSRLEDVKVKELYEIEQDMVEELQIDDYLVSIKPSAGMSYRDALLCAIKMEKAAFRLYTDLSENTPDPETRKLFLSLALEESKHMLRFELEYRDRRFDANESVF